MGLGSRLISTSIFALASLAPINMDSDVITLTTEDFEVSVATEPLMLVLFTVPWCFHCKVLAPQYEEAATALKDNNIKLSKVNCNEEVNLCMSKNIWHYPVLKVYKNGIPIDYTGPHKANRIISYMIKRTLPAVSEVTPANHGDFIEKRRVVVIAYLPSSDSEHARIFDTIAETHRDHCAFGLSTDLANAEAANITPPAIVVYRTCNEPCTKFPHPDSGFSVQEIGDWLTELLTLDDICQLGIEDSPLYKVPLAQLSLDFSDLTEAGFVCEPTGENYPQPRK